MLHRTSWDPRDLAELAEHVNIMVNVAQLAEMFDMPNMWSSAC